MEEKGSFLVGIANGSIDLALLARQSKTNPRSRKIWPFLFFIIPHRLGNEDSIVLLCFALLGLVKDPVIKSLFVSMSS